MAKLVVMLVFVAAAIAGISSIARCPTYYGPRALPGLKAEARVWRDAYGVPHIFAANVGRRGARARLCPRQRAALSDGDQRRVGQGRIAEIAGPDIVERRPLHSHARLLPPRRSSFAALSPWAQARLQAYADGVNASSKPTGTRCRRS